ncbi:uncharacterized protein PAC_12508 [Phialocephala subalpina]|uniref:J domain-containing protein n=1 Tax=Phialocephala subalpina TaxID=576137 RepID=A0A1L7XC55_9HELO|nr:uncharacterized protein PAC_12508 [Phialocephala subalpina]
MAPTAVIHDYYAILEVEQTATLGEIIKSYKRLALLRHPDRNTTHNTTGAFQLVCRISFTAISSLQSWDPRYFADIILGVAAKRGTPRPAPGAATPNQDDTKEATASISAIQKAKQERFASWSRTQKVYEDSIFELRRDIRKLQSVIREFEDIEKAERAEVAAAKSWSTWLLSPLYRKRVETDEEKEQKERDRLQRFHIKNFKERDLEKKESELKEHENLLRTKRQDGKRRREWKRVETDEEKEQKERDRLQRFHIKNFKERDLEKKESELKEHENLLRTKRQEFDNANLKDDIAKSAIEERIRAKRERERQEKERVEKREAQVFSPISTRIPLRVQQPDQRRKPAVIMPGGPN